MSLVDYVGSANAILARLYGAPFDTHLTWFRSTRFIIFDQYAKIVTEHQAEFRQIMPHAGWHEQDPEDLVESMRECIAKAVEKLEFMGWSKDSIKGFGKYCSPTFLFKS